MYYCNSNHRCNQYARIGKAVETSRAYRAWLQPRFAFTPSVSTSFKYHRIQSRLHPGSLSNDLLLLLHRSSVRAQEYQWYGWSTSLELSRLLDPLCQALKGNATRTCMCSHTHTHSTNQEMSQRIWLTLVFGVYIFSYSNFMATRGDFGLGGQPDSKQTLAWGSTGVCGSCDFCFFLKNLVLGLHWNKILSVEVSRLFWWLGHTHEYMVLE